MATSNSIRRSLNSGAEDESNLERTKDVLVILFLACVAIIVGLCMTSYLSAMLLEKYSTLWKRYKRQRRHRYRRRWYPPTSNSSSANPTNQQEANEEDEGHVMVVPRVRPFMTASTTTTIPSLTIQAGLVGMTRKERHLILEHFFNTTTTPFKVYHKKEVDDDDEEHVAAEPGNDGNDLSPCLDMPWIVAAFQHTTKKLKRLCLKKPNFHGRLPSETN
jgi:hypothetical protein